VTEAERERERPIASSTTPATEYEEGRRDEARDERR
jgi:hypothetical protein